MGAPSVIHPPYCPGPREPVFFGVIRTPHDPIVALATAMSKSALAVIRTSGKGSLELLSTLLKDGKNLAAERGNTVHRCVIRDGDEEIDETLVAVFKAPKSYTGEDSAEISCHGSMPVIQRILSLLLASGFRQAGPGEFTQRAFLNGKMDLTRAEAVNEIVRARTDRARALAFQRLSGAVEKKIEAARRLLVDLSAEVELRLDYPEEEHGAGGLDRNRPAEAIAVLEELARSYRRGRIYQEGAAVAIAGATNAGKSSLFNLLLKEDRAIVSEVHGTTRDYLEGQISLRGIPVRLFDTAGIREARDPLEAEGVKRAERVIQGADLVLYVVDSQVGLRSEDEAFLQSRASGKSAGVSTVKVWNKIDLPRGKTPAEDFIPFSSLIGDGMERLESEVFAALLGADAGESGEPLIDSQRQHDLIARALDALRRFSKGLDDGVHLDLLSVDLADALDALGEITGEVTSAEILEKMFSGFCVGK